MYWKYIKCLGFKITRSKPQSMLIQSWRLQRQGISNRRSMILTLESSVSLRWKTLYLQKHRKREDMRAFLFNYQLRGIDITNQWMKVALKFHRSLKFLRKGLWHQTSKMSLSSSWKKLKRWKPSMNYSWKQYILNLRRRY